MGIKRIVGFGLSAVPKNLTTLSISWLNGQFKAVAIHRGKVGNSWESPSPLDGPDKFHTYITQAIAETGYQGQTVSLVLSHPRLVQQMVDVPPIKGSTLQKFILRQASQQKLFPGEAAHASQPLASSKASPRVLLHLFPRAILNQLALGCRRAGLHLTSVVPVSAVLQQQIAALSLQKEDVAMLAADTGESTTVVIASGDGRLHLARTLQGSWTEGAGRIALDLNRTLLYAGQQLNVAINKGLCLFGPKAAESCAEIQKLVQVPVKVSPVACEPLYWARESLALRPVSTPNLLSVEMQTAPQRRIFAEIITVSVLILLLAALALSGYSLLQSRREQVTINSLAKQLVQMEEREAQLLRVDSELKRKEQAIQLVLGDAPQPKPAWLLAYLGQVVPTELVITNFNIKRESDYYRVKMVGTYQQALRTPTAPPIRESIAALRAQLSAAPFHMRLVEKAEAEPAQPATGKVAAARPALAEWLNRVTAKVVAQKTAGADDLLPPIDHFEIEGILR